MTTSSFRAPGRLHGRRRTQIRRILLSQRAAATGARSGSAALLAVILHVLAVATGVAQVTDTPPDPASFPHDRALFQVLAMEPGAAQLDSLIALRARTGWPMADTLAVVAEDPAIHPLLRANAALLIGRTRDMEHFIILRPLLSENDPRIRLAVVAAAREYIPVLGDESLDILRDALNDPEPAVQVRALEALSDSDVEMLREYVANGPPPQLAEIANGLIAAGEQRGAPIVPGPDGALRKSGPAGGTLIYTPEKTFASDLSVGSLELEKADGRRLALGDSVEVARNVVPAFFSMDGSRIVFENARTIRVLDVGSGAVRVVAEGVAPRPLPFTDDFLYVVRLEEGTTETRGEYRLTYEMRSVPFAGGPEDRGEPIGTFTAVASFGQTAGASPVRWMRVTEDAGMFSLRGVGIDPVPLPDPFAAGAS